MARRNLTTTIGEYRDYIAAQPDSDRPIYLGDRVPSELYIDPTVVLGDEVVPVLSPFLGAQTFLQPRMNWGDLLLHAYTHPSPWRGPLGNG